MKATETKSFLSELTIRSLGVIESAEVEFGEGFTVITGETGAGKTMVLTALNLILGERADFSVKILSVNNEYEPYLGDRVC